MELLLKRNEKPGTFGTRYDLFAKLELKPEELSRIRKAKPEKTLIVEDDYARNNFRWRLMLLPAGIGAIILGFLPPDSPHLKDAKPLETDGTGEMPESPHNQRLIERLTKAGFVEVAPTVNDKQFFVFCERFRHMSPTEIIREWQDKPRQSILYAGAELNRPHPVCVISTCNQAMQRQNEASDA